jgi:hypothetical protein
MWGLSSRKMAFVFLGNTEQVPPGLVQWSQVRSEFGLAPAESITCVIDDSALRASPFGPAAPFCLRQSRAAHPCAAARLTFSALPLWVSTGIATMCVLLALIITPWALIGGIWFLGAWWYWAVIRQGDRNDGRWPGFVGSDRLIGSAIDDRKR